MNTNNTDMAEGAENSELVLMLKTMAENNDFESQKNLAYMYFRGEGINKNMDLALFWFNIASAHIECDREEKLTINIAIGKLYIAQQNYAQSLQKFTDLFELPNLLQDIKDEIHLYIAELHGLLNDGSGKDIEIYEYFTNRTHPKVYDNAMKYSNMRMGDHYMTKKDFNQAIISYNKSNGLKIFSEEHADIITRSINNIGYANEMCGNFSEAHKYYTLASEKDYLFSTLNLGYLYENGLGVEKDMDKALEYYEKGASCLDEWKRAREAYKPNK